MKAIHFTEGGGAPDCLQLQTLDIPTPGPHDLLVEIKACSVNPVDTKIRQGKFPASDVTGYDAAGIVSEVGSEVTHFRAGDAVYYSGMLGRQGTTAQYNLVDARLAARAPRDLSLADAAAFPLVSLTAWELFVEHFGLVPYGIMGDASMSTRKNQESILIINGAGGVGSIATQFARRVFNLANVIVTASRAETRAHAEQMGATLVIDHHTPLLPQLERHGIEKGGIKYIMICHSTPQYLEAACEIAKVWGKIGSIVECDEPLQFQNMNAFTKALSFHWEFMLAKASAGVMLESQGRMLKQVATAINAGLVKPIATETLPLSVANLRKVHEKIEAGKAIGKIVLEVGSDIQ